jgi:hypothetical protein
MFAPVSRSYVEALTCGALLAVFNAVAIRETAGAVIFPVPSYRIFTDNSLSLEMINQVDLMPLTRLITCIPGIRDLLANVADAVEFGNISDVCAHTR